MRSGVLGQIASEPPGKDLTFCEKIADLCQQNHVLWRSGRSSGCFLSFELVRRLHNEKYHEGDDQEVEHVCEERPVIECDQSRFLRRVDRRISTWRRNP